MPLSASVAKTDASCGLPTAHSGRPTRGRRRSVSCLFADNRLELKYCPRSFRTSKSGIRRCFPALDSRLLVAPTQCGIVSPLGCFCKALLVCGQTPCERRRAFLSRVALTRFSPQPRGTQDQGLSVRLIPIRASHRGKRRTSSERDKQRSHVSVGFHWVDGDNIG